MAANMQGITSVKMSIKQLREGDVTGLRMINGRSGQLIRFLDKTTARIRCYTERHLLGQETTWTFLKVLPTHRQIDAANLKLAIRIF